MVSGKSISKTIMRAVKEVVRGTKSVGGQRTEPMFSWMGSTFVRYSVAFDPAAAHGTVSSSTSIAREKKSER